MSFRKYLSRTLDWSNRSQGAKLFSKTDNPISDDWKRSQGARSLLKFDNETFVWFGDSQGAKSLQNPANEISC